MACTKGYRDISKGVEGYPCSTVWGPIGWREEEGFPAPLRSGAGNRLPPGCYFGGSPFLESESAAAAALAPAAVAAAASVPFLGMSSVFVAQGHVHCTHCASDTVDAESHLLSLKAL